MGDTVALIGMGLLGSALAENLLGAGFAVRGYDVAPDRQREHAERGGIAARSPADAARGASVVMTCLMTADIVRDVLLGPDGELETAGPSVIASTAAPSIPMPPPRWPPISGAAVSRCWTLPSADRAARRAGGRRRWSWAASAWSSSAAARCWARSRSACITWARAAPAR